MRKIKFVFYSLLLLIAALITSGWASQTFFSHYETPKYSAPGQLVDVGGFKLHLHCTGVGYPTVVLDTGLGLPAASFGPLQRELSKTTRVCSYDRAGYGFSDPGPLPRTSKQVASELNTLLISAQEKGPFVLIGHSLGGLNVRTYQNLFPDDVLGLILLDAANEEIINSAIWEVFYSRFAPLESSLGLSLGSILINLGIPRFASLLAPEVMKSDFYHSDERKAIRALTFSTKNLNAALNEGHVIKQVFLDAKRDHGSIDNALLVVIAAGNLEGLELMAGSKEKADALRNEWLRLQSNLAELSKSSKFILASDSGHGIPFEHPEIVSEAAVHMIQELRMGH